MTSKLARDVYIKWQSEGLKPQLDDLITLNALGLKVEHGSEAYDFAAVPRVAFLGDATMFEPTVGKRIWIDKASQLVKDDFQTQLYFTAFALNCPDNELPQLDNVKKLMKRIVEFTSEVLIHFTHSQILCAIEYVMTGAEPTSSEDWTPQKKKDFESVYEVPEACKSYAMQILNQALVRGIDYKVAENTTMTQLERMIIVAAMHDGADVMKNEHTQAAAKFYAYVGQTHERLIKGK